MLNSWRATKIKHNVLLLMEMMMIESVCMEEKEMIEELNGLLSKAKGFAQI